MYDKIEFLNGLRVVGCSRGLTDALYTDLERVEKQKRTHITHIGNTQQVKQVEKCQSPQLIYMQNNVKA